MIDFRVFIGQHILLALGHASRRGRTSRRRPVPIDDGSNAATPPVPSRGVSDSLREIGQEPDRVLDLSREARKPSGSYPGGDGRSQIARRVRVSDLRRRRRVVLGRRSIGGRDRLVQTWSGSETVRPRAAGLCTVSPGSPKQIRPFPPAAPALPERPGCSRRPRSPQGSAPAARGDRWANLDIAPQSGEIGRGAQFEHAGFLAAGDLDRFEEAGFGAISVCLGAPERDLTLDTVQIGEPEPLAGSLDEREGILQSAATAQATSPLFNKVSTR